MLNRNKKFISKIIVTSFILALLAFLFFTWIIPEFYIPILPWMILFFTAVTIATHTYQLNLAKKDVGRLARSTMIISMVRLMLYSLFAIIYLIGNKENIVVFVLSLVIIYMVYTIMEVRSIAKAMQHNKH